MEAARLFDIVSRISKEADIQLPIGVLNLPGVLVAPHESPALAIASIVDQCDVGLVLANENGRITGSLVPSLVRDSFRLATGFNGSSFTEVVNYLEANPGSGEDPYRHEWLSLDRTHSWWCINGRHPYFTSPCPDHGSCIPIGDGS